MSIKDYQCEHLFLLIGKNPLPNYVAAKLLAKGKENAKPILYLVYSEGNRGTEEYACQLKKVLGANDFSYQDVKIVDPSSDKSIRDAIAANFPSSGVVGLHYTGGTKAMAVHAYRQVEAAVAKLAEQNGMAAHYSYLDPRQLLMRFDGRDTFKLYDPDDARDGALFQKAAVSLDNLLNLHGLKKCSRSTHSEVFKPQIVAALFAECVNDWKWRDWLKYGLQEEMKRRRPTGKAGPKEDRLDETEQQAYLETLRETPISFTYQVKRGGQLVPVRYCLGPQLHAALSAENLLTGNGELNLASLSGPDAEYFCDWLDGKWFEDFVLAKVLLVKDECHLDEYDVSLETLRESQPDDADPYFEIDVVARRGYQLFALSCTLDSRVKECKMKLFEIAHRARQLGGDEARIGLVCLAYGKNLTALKHQLKDDHIEVFGNHNNNLEALEEDLREWFNPR